MSPSAMRPARPLQFPAIDILRGFAAVSVLVYHVIEHLGWTGFPMHGPLLWFRIGWMGVDLFLVISGFVISLSIASLMRGRPFWAFAREFALRRWARIAPLYFATGAVFLVLIEPASLFQPDFAKNLLVHLLFIHNLFPAYAGSIDGPNWTIGLEVQFYTLALFLAPALARSPWWLVAGGCVAVSWSWRFAALQSIPLGEPLSVFNRFLATTQLPGTLDEFGAGILLARLVTSAAGFRLLQWGRANPVVPALAAATALWSTLALFWTNPDFWDSTAMVVVWRTLLASSFAVLLFAACCWEGKHLLVRPLAYLGDISYGIYLWHLPVILAMKRVGWPNHGESLWIILGCTLLLAAGSWHLIERPALRRMTGRGDPPSQAGRNLPS